MQTFDRPPNTSAPDNQTAPLGGGSLPSRRAGSGRRVYSVVAITFILAGLATVAGLIPRFRARSTLEETTQSLAIPTVAVVGLSNAQPAVPLLLSAELRPYLEAPIHPRATGYVRRWLVDLGTNVEAGQVLAEIDIPELNQELIRSRAELAQVEAARDLAKTTADRWAELLKTSSVAEQEAAEKKADLALKMATVEAAKANVRRLQELTGFSQVTAPFAGIITRRLVNVGDLVTAGTGVELFRVAQTGRLRVFVRVPQTLATGIVTNSIAQLTVQEYPGQIFEARVVRTAGAIEPDSRTMLTELEVDNSKGTLLAGSYAQVRFPPAPTANGVSLPANALLFRAEGLQVGLVDSTGKVTLKAVTLGRDFGPTVEVLKGVSIGDRVIVNPPDALVSGMIVRVLEPEASPAKP